MFYLIELFNPLSIFDKTKISSNNSSFCDFIIIPCFSAISSIGTHSCAEPRLILRNLLNSAPVLLDPSAIFSVIDKDALRI